MPSTRRLDVAGSGVGQPPAQLVGLGVAERVEDVQGGAPGSGGRRGVAGRAPGVAEAAPAGGLVIAVAELAALVDGPLVAGSGLVEAPEAVVGVAEAVPR